MQLDSGNKIEIYNNSLFATNYFSCSEDELVVKDNIAKDLIDKYDWSDIFGVWYDYLKSNAKNEQDIISFVNYLFAYTDGNVKVPFPYDSYDFLGYLLAKVDISKHWDECGDIFDSIAISVLSASNDLNLQKDPYYQFWKDPKVIKASKKYL